MLHRCTYTFISKELFPISVNVNVKQNKIDICRRSYDLSYTLVI